jgi:hypothetical protein
MAKQQKVIDATIDLVKLGGDVAVVTGCCKGLVKGDLVLLVGLLSTLVPKPRVTADGVKSAGNASGVASVATTSTKGTEKEEKVADGGFDASAAAESTEVVKIPPSYLSFVKSGFGNIGKVVHTNSVEHGEFDASAAAESTGVVERHPSYLSVVKSGFSSKQTKQTPLVAPTGKICRKLMDTGACEEKKSCQHLHPDKCSYYANFGLARNNPKGCKSAENCKFLHVVICRYRIKAQCKKKVCSLQHLQPKPVERTAKVETEKNFHCQSSFLGQGPLAPGGLMRTLNGLNSQGNIDDFVKVVTQSVLQSLNSISNSNSSTNNNNNNNKVSQVPQHQWGAGLQH